MRVVDENDVELTQDKLDAITDDDGYFEERFIILQHHDATDFVEQKSHVKITVNFADGTHVTLEDKDNQWPSEYFDKPYGDFKCVGKYAGKTFDSQDVETIIDVPGQEQNEAYDEGEWIKVYHPYPEKLSVIAAKQAEQQQQAIQNALAEQQKLVDAYAAIDELTLSMADIIGGDEE